MLPGCPEIQLNLLTPKESVKLLLDVGEVEVSAAASAAAAKIAKICEGLPLFLSIVGGIIAQYETDDSWQTEVLAELEQDAVGLIEEQTGDRTVALIVDSSLKMVNTFTSEVFMALGVAYVYFFT